jgi:hypothetical protein
MKQFLSLLKMDFLVNDLEFRNWKMIIYLSILALIMIASAHSTDRKIFKIAQLNDELKMLKSEFIEQRTNLMNFKMETKIIKELEPLGIGPAKIPPIKIIIARD